MNRYEFELRLSSEKFLDFYRGRARNVSVQCSTGQTVQFPANLLRKFVSPEGVHGRFVLTCDANNKLIGLERQS